MDERKNQVLSIIEELGDITLTQLSSRIPGVSVMTLRRDLIQLEKEGYILRTRGGAVSLRKLGAAEGLNVPGEENEYALRARENMDAKNRIAEKALPFVQRGTSIYLDAGSTIMCLAKRIPDETLSIITNGTNIAQTLVCNHRITVMMPGGTVNRNTLSVSGPDSLSFVDKINIELAFMSASAFSLEAGFSVSNIYEAELKHKIIMRAKRTIMLMDSSKIGKNLLFTIAALADIDILLCEKTPSAEILEAARQNGVEIL